jgi:hypothetical protein
MDSPKQALDPLWLYYGPPIAPLWPPYGPLWIPFLWAILFGTYRWRLYLCLCFFQNVDRGVEVEGYFGRECIVLHGGSSPHVEGPTWTA